MIENSITNGSKLPEECESTTMFLLEDRIKEILSEKFDLNSLSAMLTDLLNVKSKMH